MENKRQHERMHVVAYLKVRERETDQTLGRVVDITSQGMRLCSRRPLQPGSHTSFKVTFPDMDGAGVEIDFMAEVIWCNRATFPGYYDAGVQLQRLSINDEEAIECFIENARFEDRFVAVSESLSIEN